MSRNEVAILTTGFAQDSLYTKEYFQSLQDQTFKAFDLIFVNDGATTEAGQLGVEYPQLKMIEVPGTGSVAENREAMIRAARHGNYRYAIFADFDDVLSSNRVQVVVDLLKHSDVVVNDVSLLKEGHIYSAHHFSKKLVDQQSISLEMILEVNMMGMSNCGVCMDLIPQFNFFSQLRAVDWYFFSRLLADGLRATFTNECHTLYRQHGSNVGNIAQKSVEQLIVELEIKKNHYTFLADLDSRYPALLHAVEEISFNGDQSAYLNLLSEAELPPYWWNLFDSKKYRDMKREDLK